MSLAVPGSKQMALTGDRYKLISVDGGRRWMLFDLIEDPGESHDLAAQQPERVRTMRAKLEEWIKSCKHTVPRGGSHSPSATGATQ